MEGRQIKSPLTRKMFFVRIPHIYRVGINFLQFRNYIRAIIASLPPARLKHSDSNIPRIPTLARL